MEAFFIRAQDGRCALATKMTSFFETGLGSECLGLGSQTVREFLSPCPFGVWMGLELGNVALFVGLALGCFSHLLFRVLLTVSYCFQNTSKMKFDSFDWNMKYDWSKASEILLSI